MLTLNFFSQNVIHLRPHWRCCSLVEREDIPSAYMCQHWHMYERNPFLWVFIGTFHREEAKQFACFPSCMRLEELGFRLELSH